MWVASVALFLTETVTLGIAAPDTSVTTPEMVAPATWASLQIDVSIPNVNHTNAIRNTGSHVNFRPGPLRDFQVFYPP